MGKSKALVYVFAGIIVTIFLTAFYLMTRGTDIMNLYGISTMILLMLILTQYNCLKMKKEIKELRERD